MINLFDARKHADYGKVFNQLQAGAREMLWAGASERDLQESEGYP